jgi:hypothetical protein
VSLIAAYSFEETSGPSSADMTGNGHTITVNAFGTGHTGQGAVGSSSASAAAYASTMLAAPSAFTVMCWAKPVTVSGNPDIITMLDSSASTYVGAYWSDSTHIKLDVQDSAGYTESSPVALPVGSWTHIAIVVAASTVTMYFGGVQVAQITRAGTLGDQIGPYLGGHGSKGGGTYDDVRVFNTALTASDVTTWMGTPVVFSGTPSTVAPVVAWAADEGSGTSVADSSGNGRTGTASSTGWVTGHGTHAKAASGDSTHPAVSLQNVTVMSGKKTATLMGWVNAINLTGSGDLLEIKNNNGSTPTAISLYRPSATSLVAYLADSNNTQTTTGSWSGTLTGKWHHIAATLSATQLKLYVDGILAATATVAGTGDLGVVQMTYAGGTDTKFNQAAVNDVRLFDTELSASDVLYFRDTPAVNLPPHGSASGSVVHTGSASGHESPHGTATGAAVFAGSASGHTTMNGAATGSYVFAGAAAGHAQPHGAATGTLTYAGAASGTTDPHGAAAGVFDYDGSASGHTDPAATASGELDYAGTASGHAPSIGVPHGDATGGIAYTGTASGHVDRHGAAVGVYRYTGTAHGTGETTRRDITLTVTPLPTRWATSATTDRWSTEALPERWRATCLEP